MRIRIFIPVMILAVLVAVYYWAWQSSAATVRTEITEWAEEERAEGRIAEYERLRISGFPYRLQVSIFSPQLGDPEAGWSWEAERLTGFVLPYRLNHAVLVVEGDQRLEFQRFGHREVVTGAAENQRASLVLRAGALERFSLDTSSAELTREIYTPAIPNVPERTETMAIGTFQMHTRRVRDDGDLPRDGHHHAIGLNAADVIWNGHPYEGLGSDIALAEARVLAAGVPGGNIGSVEPDFLRQWQENEGILYLDEAAIRWSEIEVAGTGVFQLDNQHRLEGEATVFVSGHARAIDALVAGGALDPQYAEISITVLGVIAAIGGDPEGRIRAPLRFEDGTVFLGPAEMMELPPLY